jgi:hypothetical protein
MKTGAMRANSTAVAPRLSDRLAGRLAFRIGVKRRLLIPDRLPLTGLVAQAR